MLYNLCALLIENLKDFEAARPLVKRGLSLSPNPVIEGFNALVRAINAHDAQVTTELKEADEAFNRGRDFQTRESYADAITQYTIAIGKNPKHARALANWGVALKSLKRYNEASIKLREALDLDTNNTAIAYNLAQVYSLANVKHRGIALLQHYLAMPRNAHAAVMHTEMASMIGESDAKYDEHLKAALKIDPTQYVAHALLFQSLHKKARTSPLAYSDAMYHLAKVIELKASHAVDSDVIKLATEYFFEHRYKIQPLSKRVEKMHLQHEPVNVSPALLETPQIDFEMAVATLPIHNIKVESLVSYQGAAVFPELFSASPLRTLTHEDLAAIRLFTTAMPDGINSPASQLNQEVVSGRFGPANAWMPFARLVYQAISKITPAPAIVTANLAFSGNPTLKPGDVLSSPTFASAVGDMDGLESELDSMSFAGGQRKIQATIQTNNARLLRYYSRQIHDGQYVFLPGARFTVLSARPVGDALYVRMRDALPSE